MSLFLTIVGILASLALIGLLLFIYVVVPLGAAHDHDLGE